MNHPQTGSLREAVFAYAYEQYGHRPDTPFSYARFCRPPPPGE